MVSAFAVSCSAPAARAPAPPAAPVPAVAPAPAPAASAIPAPQFRVRIGESFSPETGDAAIRAFVPDVAATDSGGECTLNRTGGSGATIVNAYFPARAGAKSQVTITFDSARHLVRYSERHGIPHLGSMTGLSDAQRDSVMRAADAAVRSTSVSFDYAIDQAVASNRGGGKPTHAVLGTVRAMEKLESLDVPAARQERVRKLCGV